MPMSTARPMSTALKAPITGEPSSRAAAIAAQFIRALEAAADNRSPWRHWLLRDILPAAVAADVVNLPITPAAIADTKGRRETNNESRVHFAGDRLVKFPVVRDICTAFQSREATDAIRRICGANLSGTNLRIEYCQDTAGFWLEPHTDIGVKKYTMLIYLSDGPGAENWGTDVLSDANTYVGRAPSPFNSGLIFIPGDDTWHAFQPRPIQGVRRALMINFVGAEFRNRFELAYPGQPIA